MTQDVTPFLDTRVGTVVELWPEAYLLHRQNEMLAERHLT
jgi:hypothetical protein